MKLNGRPSFVCLSTLVAVTTFGAASSARAALVIDLPDITVFAPDNSTPVSGFFEVLLTLNIVTTMDLAFPPPVGGYTLNFLATGTGLTFNTLTPTVDATPLFPIPLHFSSNVLPEGGPGWRVNANDDVDTDIFAFNNAGLARVAFTIAAGHVGDTFPMTFDMTGRDQTALATADASTEYSLALMSLTLMDGSITVAAIPEVAGWQGLLLVALICAAATYVYRRWRVAPASRSSIG